MKIPKPMSHKQSECIKGIETMLGIKYDGPSTAQGAWLFTQEHIENARTELRRRIAAERATTYRSVHRTVSSRVIPESHVMDRMEFYRFSNAEHDTGDEDTTYAETPTRESLDSDLRYWSLFL